MSPSYIRSDSSDLNAISDVSSRSQTHSFDDRQSRGSSTTTQHVAFYVPDGNRIFDELAKVEVNVIKAAPALVARTLFDTIACRVYYAVLFNVMIILSRLEAGTANSDEEKALNVFDSHMNLRTLPIHSSLVTLFRDTFPRRRPSGSHFGISPEMMNPVRYQLLPNSKNGPCVNRCYITSTHAAQPSPLLGIKLIQWYNWQTLNDSELDELNDIQRITQLFTQFRLPDLPEDNMTHSNQSNSILRRLFMNPVFSNKLPMNLVLNKSSIAQQNQSNLPSHTWPPSLSDMSYDDIAHHLLLKDHPRWLTKLKYIVGSSCNMVDELTTFNEVMFAYSPEEARTTFEQNRPLPEPTLRSRHLDYAYWLNMLVRAPDQSVVTLTSQLDAFLNAEESKPDINVLGNGSPR